MSATTAPLSALLALLLAPALAGAGVDPVMVGLPPPGAARSGATGPAAPVETKAAPPAQVEVAVRRLADQLAAAWARRPSSRYERVAVVDLAEIGEGAKKRSLGKVVGAELATVLHRDHGWLLVERARLGAILGELKLVEMGLVEKKAQQVGQMAEAQALVTGSVSEAGDRYLVTVRLVSTEKGEVLAAASESIQAASLVALSSEAVVLRSRWDAVYRSALIPGWGQAYNKQPAKAALFGGTTALLLGGALAFQLAGMNAESDYQALTTPAALGADPQASAADLRKQAENCYTWRNYMLYGAAAVWAINVGDAWFSGTDGERMVVGVAPGPGGGGLYLAGRF